MDSNFIFNIYTGYPSAPKYLQCIRFHMYYEAVHDGDDRWLSVLSGVTLTLKMPKRPLKMYERRNACCSVFGFAITASRESNNKH